MAFARVGLAADTGVSWTLPRIVGHAKAAELLMLAEPVAADDALRLGLLTELADDDEQVLPTAQELAARLAAGPTVAYGQIKRELVHGARRHAGRGPATGGGAAQRAVRRHRRPPRVDRSPSSTSGSRSSTGASHSGLVLFGVEGGGPSAT